MKLWGHGAMNWCNLGPHLLNPRTWYTRLVHKTTTVPGTQDGGDHTASLTQELPPPTVASTLSAAHRRCTLLSAAAADRRR